MLPIVVLSIGKLTGGAASARYYESSVATGREDYYTGRGESRGRWVGTGATEIGLTGAIGDGCLEQLLVKGSHPTTGAPLRARVTQVQGFDLTFSVPKSVSILFAVGEPEVRAAVLKGHEAAMAQALAYLEREAVQVRRGRAGLVKERAEGLVAGAYRHRSSRAGDPQIHTHVVVANLARGADGRWTALHAAPLFAHAKTTGYLYQAALRDQLANTLGVRWSAVIKGAAELEGIPAAVIEHFSTRRAEIVSDMHERGTSGPDAARVAALSTRKAKTYDVDAPPVYLRWKARASEHGLDATTVAAALGHSREPADPARLQQAAQLMSGSAGLTLHASTFTRREALQAWAEHHRDGAPVARIEQIVDRWLASDLVVQVDGEPPAADKHQRRVADHEDRFSTPDMLATEQRLVETAAARVDVGIAVARADAVESTIAERPFLGDDQREMVRALTTSGDGIQVVRAKAGSGKTTALDAAREAWQRSGLTVIGTALGSYATRELVDAGIDAFTIARLWMDIERHGLPRGSVLLVDEAGMVGTRTIAMLAHHAEHAQAKLVLVGDDHQLPEIDAGGAFRGLARRLGAVELHHNRRQRDPDDRHALDAHRAGEPDALVQSLRRRGRITVAPDVQGTRHALVGDWWRAVETDGIANATMIALRRSEVRELNAIARQHMRAAGRLGNREVRVGHTAFAVGDRVVTRHNAPRLGVVNGSRGEITDLAEDGSLQIRLDKGDHRFLPAGYVVASRHGRLNVEHGYAITAHSIQGGTTDRTFVLGSEDTYREWGYVAFSRHRIEARFYITAPDTPEHEQLQLDANLADITRALGRSRAKGLAIDVAAKGELRAMPDDRLATEAEHLRDLLETAPTSALLALDEIDKERAKLAADLQRITSRLTRADDHGVSAARQEHRILRERRSGIERAKETYQRRATELERQRAQLLRHHGDPTAWLESHHDALARLAAIEHERSRRHELARSEAMRMVTVVPPHYVVAELGPRPEDLTGQRAWDRGARIIESYRHRHHVTINPTERGLGPPPADASRRGAYFAAARRLNDIRAELPAAPSRPAVLSMDLGPDR